MISKLALLTVSSVALAHEVSVSNGELRIDGTVARYQVFMHMHDDEHARDLERTIYDAISIEGANLTERVCSRAGETYTCTAKYVFRQEPETARIRVQLHRPFGANHVHMLTTQTGRLEHRTIFDSHQTEAELRVREALPSVWTASVLLAIFALALLPRTAAAAGFTAAIFAAAAGVALFFHTQASWSMKEAALAIASAYAAAETLFIPVAHRRPVSAAVLGAAVGFHGDWRVTVVALAGGLGVAHVLKGRSAVLRAISFATLPAALLWFLVVVI